jgi:hypothetical protein
MIEARALTSKGKSAADELVSFDNPIFAKNFKLLLKKTMQDDGTTWEAVLYLGTLSQVFQDLDTVSSMTIRGGLRLSVGCFHICVQTFFALVMYYFWIQ